MNRKVELKALRVIPARDTEIHKGWVRLSEDSRGGIPSGRYVRLAHGGRKIHCQLRGQLEGKPEKDCVEMSEYYRDKLGLAPGEVFGIEIEEVGQCGRLRALFDHPDDTVRVAMHLGAIGVGLGLISLVLGLVGVSLGLIGLTLGASSSCRRRVVCQEAVAGVGQHERLAPHRDPARPAGG